MDGRLLQLDRADPLRNLALFDGLDIVSNGNNQNARAHRLPRAERGLRPASSAWSPSRATTASPATQLVLQRRRGAHRRAEPGEQLLQRHALAPRRARVASPAICRSSPARPRAWRHRPRRRRHHRAAHAPGRPRRRSRRPSTGDVYYLARLRHLDLDVQARLPHLHARRVVDVNGGALVPGDVLEYTIVATNTGNDTVGQHRAHRPAAGRRHLRAGLDRDHRRRRTQARRPTRPATIRPSTTPPRRTVTVRLGTGATGATGGTIAHRRERRRSSFQVTVDANASGTSSNQANITAGGQLGAPATVDADRRQRRRPRLARRRTSRSTRASTTPTARRPRRSASSRRTPTVCVERILDTQCPGDLRLLIQGRTCAFCVPSGAETCDGKDNDCNGQTDEGFNVGGGNCTAGVGSACRRASTSATGSAARSATPCRASPRPRSAAIRSTATATASSTTAASTRTATASPTRSRSLLGTDPNDADSDDDGVLDGAGARSRRRHATATGSSTRSIPTATTTASSTAPRWASTASNPGDRHVEAPLRRRRRSRRDQDRPARRRHRRRRRERRRRGREPQRQASTRARPIRPRATAPTTAASSTPTATA